MRNYISIVFIAISFGALSQKNPLPNDLSGSSIKIPFDFDARHGVLKNGFSYYIRNNAQATNEIEIYFVVKAGTLYEDEDQLGLGHFVEHMGFRSLKHFPNGIYNYLLEEGIKRGTNINAWTAPMFTCYYLKIPATKKTLLTNCLAIVRDWADGLSLLEGEVNSERGAILAEVNGNGEEDRKMHDEIAKLLKHPMYPSNLQQNIIESFKGFKYESLVRFYKKWYRSDREAIIIVGDVDVNKTETELVKVFSSLKSSKKSVDDQYILPKWSVKPNGQNEIIQVPTTQSMGIKISLYFKSQSKIPFSQKKYVDQYRTLIKDQLYAEMSRFRFEARATSRASVTIFSAIDRTAIYKPAQLEALYTSIGISDRSHLKDDFQEAIKELERIRRYGFDSTEFERAKRIIRKKSILVETKDSRSIADKYLGHFVFGAAAPNPEYEVKLIASLIEDISLKEVNEMLRDWLSRKGNRDIIIKADTDVLGSLEDTTIWQWFSEVEQSKIYPLANAEFNYPVLINTISKTNLNIPLQLVEKEIPGTGAHELNLKGMRIVLKPLKKPNGQNKLYLQAFRSGGALMYKGSDHPSAGYAAEIINKSGVGGLDELGLKKFLWGQDVWVNAYINDSETGIHGNAPVEDAETLLQLVNLYFTSPNKDSTTFNEWLAEKREFYKMDSILNATSQKKPVGALFNKVSFEKAYSIFRDRFNNGSEFTFVLVGDFDLEIMKHLVIEYLGSLPATPSKPTIDRSLIIQTPAPKKNDLKPGHVMIKFSNHCIYRESQKVRLDVLAEYLQIKLYNRLRVNEGAVYGVNVSANYSRNETCAIVIDFTTDPDKSESMKQIVYDEIEYVKTNTIEIDLFKQALSQIDEVYKINIRSDLYWLKQLVEAYRYNDCYPMGIHNQILLNEIESQDLCSTAREYLVF